MVEIRGRCIRVAKLHKQRILLGRADQSVCGELGSPRKSGSDHGVVRKGMDRLHFLKYDVKGSSPTRAAMAATGAGKASKHGLAIAGSRGSTRTWSG